ncbi:unnamed protein product [Paramecium pentaurelia]|uniref:Transmembrane protein n=1 Tax=Paramecium pentaurelia TaxID=43138 RepID=A0A8S1Y7C6_9CILI|nr:unnamed protein product [Paramecium pentaurelia]
MQRQVYHLIVLLLLLSANCFLHNVYEEFNTKQILFTNTILRCIKEWTQQSYDKKIKYIIKFRTQQLTLNYPTFKSIYGYLTIDDNESFFLAISEKSFQYSFCLKPTSLGKSFQQCSGQNNDNNNKLIRKSFFKRSQSFSRISQS